MTTTEKLQHDLKMKLTRLDRKNAGKRGYNPYALGQYFQAAEGVVDAASFARAFCPTREMHAIAREMGFPLDVEKGNWVKKG
jgi:hypothetical protein